MKDNIGKSLYFEWLIPLVDYFKTLQKKEFIFEIAMPLIISIIVTCIYHYNNLVNIALSKMGNILPTVLAILIGFTISSISIIITSNNENRNVESYRELDSKPILLYQYMLIMLIYVLIQEIINLVLVFFIAFISPIVTIKIWKSIFLSMYVFYILHILLIIVRVVVQIYTVSYNQKNK